MKTFLMLFVTISIFASDRDLNECLEGNQNICKRLYEVPVSLSLFQSKKIYDKNCVKNSNLNFCLLHANLLSKYGNYVEASKAVKFFCNDTSKDSCFYYGKYKGHVFYYTNNVEDLRISTKAFFDSCSKDSDIEACYHYSEQTKLLDKISFVQSI